MHGSEIRIKRGRIDGGKFVNVAPGRVDEERCFLVDRPTEIAVKNVGVVAGLGCEHERVARVEDRVAVVEEKLTVIFVAAGLGEDLNAAVAELVILRGKRVLVDANLANGRLRRKRAASESIDVNLTAVGTCGRAGERLQFRLKLVGVVRERLKILSLDN